MQIKHESTAIARSNTLCKISSMCWSPNGSRFASVDTERLVKLFDGEFTLRDSFSLKPAPNCPKNFIVKGMVFSPDSTMIGFAQSDCVVYIYKIGLEWGDKKSICCRIQTNSSVSCITWPSRFPNDFVFGLADGSVKSGKIQKNRMVNLYNTDSFVVSCVSNPDGSAIATGHIDGSIFVCRFTDEIVSRPGSSTKIATHMCPPIALTWGKSICASGSNSKICFYDPEEGKIIKTFDYSQQMNGKEFGCSQTNYDGDITIFGGFNKFVVSTFSSSSMSWDISLDYQIVDFLSVTSIAWRPDGSKVCISSVTGAVEVFELSQKKCLYDRFVILYVSPSRIIITDQDTGDRTLMNSKNGYSITKIHIHEERYVTAFTSDTLILADLVTKKFSEIRWKLSGKEKFSFDNENICIAYNVGELHIVEYGKNEVLGSYRTGYMNRHLVSARNNERPFIQNGIKAESNRKIAYLLDMYTIRIVDIDTGYTISTINSLLPVDFLELNSRCTYLVFRDKKRQLHLYDIISQSESALLSFGSYVQWVPYSDVLVAQTRNTLCVWYSIVNTDSVTQIPIKGEIEEIQREAGKTQVIVNDGNNYVEYPLDEGLIGFGIALEDNDLKSAVLVLEGLQMNQETENMWRQLLTVSYEADNLYIAERCASALCDVSKARFIHKINKLNLSYPKDELGRNHWMVECKKQLFMNNYKRVEDIYIDNGKIDEAIEMYQSLHKYEEAISIAEKFHHNNTEDMKANYYKYLIDTQQEDKAAHLKQLQGEYKVAIDLYILAGLPNMSCQIAMKYPSSCGDDVKERITHSLIKCGLYSQAGTFLENQNKYDRALEIYLQGHVYQNAVDLCRNYQPNKVTQLEEQWGDYLVNQNQLEAAVNHYIESNNPHKAIQCCLDSKQMKKAVQMINEVLKPEDAVPYYKIVADYYRDIKEYNIASVYYIKANKIEDAIAMYNSIKRWSEAEKLAQEHLSPQELKRITIKQAKELEGNNDYKEAERLYLRIKEVEMAISMYRKLKRYQDAIRLVNQYKPQLSKEIHQQIAQELENDANLKEAEYHYLEGGEYRNAISMYIQNNEWEQAIRVAKSYGTPDESTQIAFQWAKTLGGQAGANLLFKNGLINESISYSIENHFYDYAFDIAKSISNEKINYVHICYGEFLEHDNHINEAEKEYINGHNVLKAIEMRLKRKEWDSAIKLASEYDNTYIANVFLEQASDSESQGLLEVAEDLFMRANRPDKAIDMHVSHQRFDDAIRIAKDFAPQKVKEIAILQMSGEERGGEKVAKMLEEAGEYERAIDVYIKISLSDVGGDDERLCNLWKQGVLLCSKYNRQRYPQIVEIICQKFTNLKRYEIAGDLYLDVTKYEHALECYLAGEKWKKALDLASKRLPQHYDRVRSAYNSYLLTLNNFEDIPSDEYEIVIRFLIDKGEWEKVFKMCSTNPTQLSVYSMQYASKLVKESQFDKAAIILARYGLSNDLNMITVCRDIVKGILNKTRKDELATPNAFYETKKFLRNLSQLMKTNPQFAQVKREFETYLLIIHYYQLIDKCKNTNLIDIVMKLYVSLVKFCDIIPSDKVFYQASIACRDNNEINMSFLFMNRFLDITDAIDDGNRDLIPNNEFVGTTIPSPDDFNLPKVHYLDDDELEKIKDWVMSTSIDSHVISQLKMTNCMVCNEQTFEGDLQCKECKHVDQPCIVSGYRILRPIQCKICHTKADEESWNRYVHVFKQCAWCDESQGPSLYTGKSNL